MKFHPKGKFFYFYFFEKLPHQFFQHCAQLDKNDREYMILINPFISQWWESHQDEFKNSLQPDNLKKLKMGEKLKIGKTLACLSRAEIEDEVKKECIEKWCQDFW